MGNFTLIVTEKPDAAKRIAYALDSQGKPKNLKINNVPYFVAQRDRKLVVVPALGHIYTVVQENGKNNSYPILNFKWAPRYLAERRAKIFRNLVESFSKLSQDADEFISACDYDIEGCLIGYCILKYACGNKEVSAKRMKFSTLMKSELEKAYEEPLPHLNFAFIDAGRARHEVDWLYGINLSRALTLAAHHWSGRYSTLSTGRVQGPTLRCLTKREKAIRSFVPTPYWEITAEVEVLTSIINAEYEKKRIETLSETKIVMQHCMGKNAKVKNVDVRKVHQKPPLPFDVGSLQREAYKLFGYTPRRTLAIAQHLYVNALISYPRTNSQKLPPIIDYKKIIKSLEKQRKYKKLASKLLRHTELKPREGAKEDPAHPAIYPTGTLPEKPLGIQEQKIWDLIIRRFMTVFAEDALKESIKVHLDLNDHSFFLRGKRILKKGWLEYYKPYVYVEEITLPPFKEGDNIRIRRLIQEEKFTSPPTRYNPSSLLKKMEELGIGTKATRADIIQTLQNRGYIKDERIVVTELGFDVTDVLDRYAPVVVSVALTKELEDKMGQIQNGRTNRERVLQQIIGKLKSQLESFKDNEEAIGKVLTKAIKKAQAQERTVGKCPNCNTGTLAIIYSRRTRKRFIGCTNYFNGLCETSFPLPQRGTLKPSRTTCKSCGWPKVRVWFRAKRPWSLCFNPKCSDSKRCKKHDV